MKIDFEQFLIEQHAEQYCGAKDNESGDCADWLEQLNTDEFIEFGDLYAKSIKVNAELLEALKRLVERIDFNGGIGEYKGGPSFVMKYAREAIARWEK